MTATLDGSWLSWDEATSLPLDTCLRVAGTFHEKSVVGRLISADSRCLVLRLAGGARMEIAASSFRRARPDEMFRSGDWVLLREMPQSAWSGIVTRSEGADVLCETATGMEWHPEVALETPEARDRRLRSGRRGRLHLDPTAEPGDDWAS